jgi:uroporphyrinogen-III synthase
LKIKKILVSKPEPVDYEKSPYSELSKKYGLDITFKKFFSIEGLTPQEFRRQKINIPDFTAVIFTCKNAVDFFFNLCTGLRVKLPETMKYFCISESTAYYLQKYVQFRKRKIFHGCESPADLLTLIKKHSQEKFLLPCTDNVQQEIVRLMTAGKIHFKAATIYKTQPADFSEVDIQQFHMLVYFSPQGIESLFHNYPDYKQGTTHIAVFGKKTADLAKAKGLKVSIEAPTEKAPSMTMAIDQFLEKNKK